MGQTLLRYVALYNHQLPQSALHSKTPMQAMKQWLQRVPDDPGGLLRRKFQLEYQRRQQQGDRR